MIKTEQKAIHILEQEPQQLLLDPKIPINQVNKLLSIGIIQESFTCAKNGPAAARRDDIDNC